MTRYLAILIHNILTTPNALYEMEDWLKPLDAEKLGLRPEESQLIQDDRVGRALARFYDSRHKDVFFRLALRAIKIFDLDCSQIHHDTTTVTFCGKYGGWSATELLTHGHNKDHRPDLKQLVLGLNVTADGAVPISHRIYAGNQTDDRLHPANHKALQKLLQRTDFIYVADCKLATEENLQKTFDVAWPVRDRDAPNVERGRAISRQRVGKGRFAGDTSCPARTTVARNRNVIATISRREITPPRRDIDCTGSAARKRPNRMRNRVRNESSGHSRI